MDHQVTIDLEKLQRKLIEARYMVLVSIRPTAPARSAYMRTVQALVDTLRGTPGFDEKTFLNAVRLEVTL